MTDQEARERPLKRRDELGDAEIQRRQKLADQAQEICFALLHHSEPYFDKDVGSLVKLAEELRERLNDWTWGK